MTRIALLHNRQAGRSKLDVDKLARRFASVGFKLLYRLINNREVEDQIPSDVTGVIIAGGDGTISKIAPYLALRDLPFCILPLGTANNIATSLGQLLSADDLPAALRDASIRDLDLGVVQSPLGRQTFLESVGIGVLVEVMKEMSTPVRKVLTGKRPEKKMASSYDLLFSKSEHFDCPRYEVSVDDKAISDRFLLVKIMNMGFIGPGLELAPQADPGDGWLDVVYVREGQRETWRAYVDQLRRNRQGGEPPRFEVERCRKAELRDMKWGFHVDGDVFESAGDRLSVRLEPGALKLLDIGASQKRSAN
jgi:diacylglycerol kinase (ATP)